jgi:hypothetical protein
MSEAFSFFSFLSESPKDKDGDGKKQKKNYTWSQLLGIRLIHPT